MFNARIGPTPLCPELPVRETKLLCRPMEVTPAPPTPTELSAGDGSAVLSVPTAALPKLSRVPSRNVTMMHRHRLMQHH